MQPYISIDPAMRFGRPQVRHSGTSAVVVAEAATTNGVDQACADFGMPRSDVLLACWYQAEYDTDQEWEFLRNWAYAARRAFVAHDYDAIPDPPMWDEVE